ncbi:GntR family transcriptional regulator [Hoeflea sp. AS16]|uniref:GntR family transcriptional regulator n=1 Tax=unclassified Hoeflea TaxID=2614931 RepID=UPI00316B9501
MISRSTKAWEILRNAIVSGRLKPGAPLKTSELQELCGMSVSPVREALARLVATGLATAEHNHGYRVAPLSASDLQDLVDTRIREESWALKRSIENGDEMWEGRILSSLHVLERLPRENPEDQSLYNEQWETRHSDFHNTLISECGSKLTLGFCETLRDQSDRYRRLSLVLEGGGRNARNEHREIAEATIARDAPRAIEALSSHYSMTARYLLETYVEE